MSYSFVVKGTTKEAAKAAVAAKMDEIVSQQEVHKVDRDAVVAHAGNVIDLLADDATRDISVSCNGYVGWVGVYGTEEFKPTGMSVACSANYTERA